MAAVRRTAMVGEVTAYIDEIKDLAVLTMSVREAVMLMALAGMVGGLDRPGDVFDAIGEALGWKSVRLRDAAKWHERLYAEHGFQEPKMNEHGVIVMERVES